MFSRRCMNTSKLFNWCYLQSTGSGQLHAYTQQARDAESMLFRCWATVEDGGPTSKQHWHNVSCLPGSTYTLNHAITADSMEQEIRTYVTLAFIKEYLALPRALSNPWRNTYRTFGWSRTHCQVHLTHARPNHRCFHVCCRDDRDGEIFIIWMFSATLGRELSYRKPGLSRYPKFTYWWCNPETLKDGRFL